MVPPLTKRQRKNTAAENKTRNDATSPQLLELINQKFGEHADLIQFTEHRILGELRATLRINSITMELHNLAGRVQELEAEAGEVRALTGTTTIGKWTCRPCYYCETRPHAVEKTLLKLIAGYKRTMKQQLSLILLGF